MTNKPGYSFGPEHPIHFDQDDTSWYVFDARTMTILESGLKRWEASIIALNRNEELGFGCKPDISAIDSTP